MNEAGEAAKFWEPASEEERAILERALRWAHDEIDKDPERHAEFLAAWDEWNPK